MLGVDGHQWMCDFGCWLLLCLFHDAGSIMRIWRTRSASVWGLSVGFLGESEMSNADGVILLRVSLRWFRLLKVKGSWLLRNWEAVGWTFNHKPSCSTTLGFTSLFLLLFQRRHSSDNDLNSPHSCWTFGLDLIYTWTSPSQTLNSIWIKGYTCSYSISDISLVFPSSQHTLINAHSVMMVYLTFTHILLNLATIFRHNTSHCSQLNDLRLRKRIINPSKNKCFFITDMI